MITLIAVIIFHTIFFSNDIDVINNFYGQGLFISCKLYTDLSLLFFILLNFVVHTPHVIINAVGQFLKKW